MYENILRIIVFVLLGIIGLFVSGLIYRWINPFSESFDPYEDDGFEEEE